MDRYRRAMPIANKKMREHYVKQCDELHAKRLREMRPSVDCKEPNRWRHITKDGKKKFLMEERYQQIEYDNRLLLGRMSEIMKHHKFSGNQNEALKFKHRSLNKDGRKKELLRITAENQLILQRIQQVRPEYDHIRWEEEAKRQLQYKKNICEYPPLELKRPSPLSSGRAASAPRSR